jgi:hypothetical protein
MEAWKFVDYYSLSPVFALSLTTERWGLEPFPGNLAAITGYWQDIQGSNNTVEPAWTLPYSCSSSDSSSSYYYTYGDWVNGYFGGQPSGPNISASANICPEPQPCADSGCIILIEGILETTTGPANSSIVGLAHGISSLLAITITIAIIMGSCFSTPNPPVKPQVQLGPANLRVYNPPPQREQTYAERAATAANTAKEIARCSDLLRQMYALDLNIWGMEGNIPAEHAEREENMRRANALFAEIRRVVHTWRARPTAKWSAEERQHIEEICRFVDKHDARRYEA